MSDRSIERLDQRPKLQIGFFKHKSLLFEKARCSIQTVVGNDAVGEVS